MVRIVAVVSVSAALASAGQPPALPDLLRAGGAYVEQFQSAFSRVLSTERSQQTVRSVSRRGARTRQIESETFFTGVDGDTWMTIRDVLRVDGRRVPDSHDRVMDALTSSDRNRLERLRTLAFEGARFNIGTVGRTFNDPALALMFLDPDLQPHFAFTLDRPQTIDGIVTQRVQFKETGRPSLIQDERDRLDAVITGVLNLTDSGEVLRTELSVSLEPRVTARIEVRYRRDAKVEMLVPISMVEDYRTDDGPGRGVTLIACTAKYSNYRRFETSAKVLP